ncbi:hypothetical protein B9Z55_001234 [Caenorhabditis nigoni]|uniref:Biogenesis of lysosome-related organelles complex 1 subunit 6 n=1 Tax=Caenorhabditis nigoni TaxID=1611254 RepID=A0A2G5VEZ9_9PELO|nr:hypothetical protein B9Z55_001234 [Caenorhabditis nigoni]
MSASQNDESKNLTDTLDEILKLQEELQTRIGSSNHNLETNFENIKDFVSRAHAYIPILKQISKDMIEICERTQALKKRTRLLESAE